MSVLKVVPKVQVRAALTEETLPIVWENNVVAARKKNSSPRVEGLFEMENVLSASECASLIAQGEQRGFRSLEHEFLPEERNNERVLVLDTSFAQVVWKRIEPCLVLDDVLFVQPSDFGNGGGSIWRPHGCNPCFKLCRYREGQVFEKHVDGPWVPIDDECSVFTVLVYLNDVVSGGETRFFSDDGGEQMLEIAPRRGNAVCFFHDTIHSSAPVVDTKFVLRTEMMFHRVNTSEIIDRFAYLQDPAYHRLVSVYAASQDAFERGDVRGFTENYKDAIALQRQQVRPAQAQRFGRGQLPFPTDICVMIMCQLSLSDVVSCSRVSKHFRELSMDIRIWKPLYEAYFCSNMLPASAPSFFRAHLGAKILSSTKNRMDVLTELRDRREAERGTQDTTEKGTEGDASSLFLSEMLRQKEKLRQQSFSYSIQYFQMFKRETNMLRGMFPTVVVDLHMEKMTVGVESGCNGNGLWMEKMVTTHSYGWKRSFGDFHYRSVHYDFSEHSPGAVGGECEKIHFCDPSGQLKDSYIVAQYLQRYTTSPHAVFLVESLQPWKKRDFNFFMRSETILINRGFVLLRLHKQIAERTVIIGRAAAYGGGVVFWKNGNVKTVRSSSDLSNFEPFDTVIFDFGAALDNNLMQMLTGKTILWTPTEQSVCQQVILEVRNVMKK